MKRSLLNRRASARNSARAAFTLMEVTLATAIFAVAIVVLTSAFANALTALSNRRHEAKAEPTLQYLRSRIITVPDLYQFETGEELYLPGGDSATWSAEVEPMPVADLFKVNLHIELRSSDEDLETERNEVLYLLRPTWSDAEDRADIIEEAEDSLEDQKRSVGVWE